MGENLQENKFFENVAQILNSARENAKTAVNIAMVYAYYEIGRTIVEEEQNGKGRAEYGKRMLRGLSEYLTEKFGKGFSVDNLKLSANFTKHMYQIKLAKQCLANLKIFRLWEPEESFA